VHSPQCLVLPIVNVAKINPSKMISPVDPDITGLQGIIKKELTQAKTYSPPGKFAEEGLNKHLLNYVKENLLEDFRGPHSLPIIQVLTK